MIDLVLFRNLNVEEENQRTHVRAQAREIVQPYVVPLDWPYHPEVSASGSREGAVAGEFKQSRLSELGNVSGTLSILSER